MFEAAELGRKIEKADYKKQALALRGELLDVQRRLSGANTFPVIIVFAGVDGAGKGETVNLLSEWMDPRWIVTRAFGAPSDEERERPEYWRYWRNLPPRGRIGLFLSSWYSRPILDRVNSHSSKADFARRLDRAVQFERTLTANNALILKFWMHLGKSQQKRRLRKLEKDALTRWRVSKLQWKHWRMYDRFIEAAEQAMRQTSTVEAPWLIVEGEDEGYRSVTVATTIRDAINKALAENRGVRPPVKPAAAVAAAKPAKAASKAKAAAGAKPKQKPKSATKPKAKPKLSLDETT
jgi:polyphosphate kinase 2 (PPK2 family)